MTNLKKKTTGSITIEALEQQINRALHENISPVERGRIYTETLLAYLQIKNELDTEYLTALETGMRHLAELMEDERKQGDDVDKDIIRKKLQEIDDMD